MFKRPSLGFWFDFSSPYSYLSAMRIEAVAADRGLDLTWNPFLLSPILGKQGYRASPYVVVPDKGRYMRADMMRQCEIAGLSFRLPDPFPQNPIPAGRVALAARKEPWIGRFVRSVFHAEFAEGRDITDQGLLTDLLQQAGADPALWLARAETMDIKIGLRVAVTEAEHLGIFGAPSFITPDGELFWGNDRLDEALDWSLRITH